MENSITGEITKLLKEGKTVKEIIGLGYKPRTVYHVQSRLKKQPPPLITKAAKPPQKSAKPTLPPPLDDNLENDPEIIQLKKEVRKAELNRSIKEITVKNEIDELVELAVEWGTDFKKTCKYYEPREDFCLGLKWHEESAIPKNAGKPLHDATNDCFRVRPSPLLCVLCPLTSENQKVWPRENNL
ncbi:MAG: hypothetical protein ABR886_02535 [Dehalococcoidales bacterium]